MYETTGPIKLKGGLLKNKVAKQAGGDYARNLRPLRRRGGLCKRLGHLMLRRALCKRQGDT